MREKWTEEARDEGREREVSLALSAARVVLSSAPLHIATVMQ